MSLQNDLGSCEVIINGYKFHSVGFQANLLEGVPSGGWFEWNCETDEIKPIPDPYKEAEKENLKTIEKLDQEWKEFLDRHQITDEHKFLSDLPIYEGDGY